MRTILTSYDIKNIIKNIFTSNSEQILLKNEDNGTEETKSFAEYLNIQFFSWKNRLVEKETALYENEESLVAYDSWVQSLNFSMDEAYALVEIVDEEATASQDIDAATKIGKITFIIQTNKVNNLEYYIAKLKNQFLGAPQIIENADGEKIKAYIMLGALIYDEEPTDMQLGECVVCSCNFTINYLTNALSYMDTKIEISLDGDDTYTNGQIPEQTNYLEMPLSRATWQNIFSATPLITEQRPDLGGYIVTALINSKTFSFYDFNQVLTMRLNDLFWRLPAIIVDGVPKPVENVNVPIYIRVTSNGHFYVYKDVIEKMEKVITNSDFNISSITLKGWGKIG